MEHTSSSSVGIVEGEYVGLNIEDTVGVDRTKLFSPKWGATSPTGQIYWGLYSESHGIA